MFPAAEVKENCLRSHVDLNGAAINHPRRAAIRCHIDQTPDGTRTGRQPGGQIPILSGEYSICLKRSRNAGHTTRCSTSDAERQVLLLMARSERLGEVIQRPAGRPDGTLASTPQASCRRRPTESHSRRVTTLTWFEQEHRATLSLANDGEGRSTSSSSTVASC